MDPNHYMISKYFPHSSGCLFPFLKASFTAPNFTFNVVHFVCFFLSLLMLLVTPKKHILVKGHGIYFCFLLRVLKF